MSVRVESPYARLQTSPPVGISRQAWGCTGRRRFDSRRSYNAAHVLLGELVSSLISPAGTRSNDRER